MVRGPLNIAVAQPSCAAFDVAANAAAHAVAVVAAGARVVVFPELSLTGYELDAPPVAVADERLAPLVAACAANGTLALAGAPIAAEDGRRHIAVLAVDGGGVRIAYRKIWLGAEEAAAGFVPGPAPAVLAVDGWRVGLAVCKDTGVEEHAAATAAVGMDLYAAGVAHHDVDAHVNAERARRAALAHGVWAATASFAGPTGGGHERTAGRSGVWDPAGVAVASAGPAPGEVVTATLRAQR
jgi:predicted amidohydrolase